MMRTLKAYLNLYTNNRCRDPIPLVPLVERRSICRRTSFEHFFRGYTIVNTNFAFSPVW